MITKTSKGYSCLLAFLPLLMPYKIPGLSLGITTVLTLLGMIYAMMILIQRPKSIPWGIMSLFILYSLYVMTQSSILNIILTIAVLVHLLAIGTGIVNVKQLRRLIETVAVVAAACVIIQQIIHVLTGIHIPLIMSGMTIDAINSNYALSIATGMSDIDGMYRPCAFFLEPAYFSQYCIIGLGSCLFHEKPNVKKALIITLGILMCTSGMGLVSAIAMWGWWKLNQKKFRPGTLIIGVVAAIIAFYILDHISFTHGIINRLTASEDSGDYNAISGRLWWWHVYFEDFKLSDLIFGFGLDNLPEDGYFTGFMKTVFCYGIVGFAMLFLFLLNLFIKSESFGKACVGLFILLLFFANLTSYVSLIFYIGTYLTLYVSYRASGCKKTKVVGQL